jgi:hypothetical protein
MRMKVQGHSGIAEVKRAHQISMHHTSKSIASTRMDADLWRIGTKISDLRGKKARAESMTPTEIISKLEVATQAEAEAGAKIKKDLFITCSMRKTRIFGQGIVLFF